MRELTRLLRDGFLIARDDVCRADARPDRPQPITSITVVTRDRVELLRRAVEGYADNCRRHGRDVEFAVGDDSPAPAVRASARTVLGELADQTGVRISYAGPEEKAAFLDRLARAGGIPPEVLRFGCLGAGASVTVGANRNAMLLQTAGEATLGVDDDTVCQLGRPPGPATRATLDPGGNPLALWFHPDRASAVAAAPPADDDDLLGWHDRHLGHDCGALLARIDADLDSADAATLRRLALHSGRVRLTTNGTAGDCGWDNPWFTLLQDGATHARLVASAEDYRVARLARDMVQAAAGTTITLAQPRLATCLAVDNTDLVPPFAPVGRAEEVAFGALFARCFPDAYAAHLPVVVPHDPPGERRFADTGFFAVSLGSWLPACLDRFDVGFADEPVERLQRLGQHLEDLGRQHRAVVEDVLRQTVWISTAGLVAGLEARLDAAEGAPGPWVRDVERMLGRIRRDALAEPDELCAGVGGVIGLQRLLGLFGELLTWWPQIVSTARQLRDGGDRMAVAVGSSSRPEARR